MKIDCHVHSYPLLMPGGLGKFSVITPYGGLRIDEVEDHLKKLEDKEGIIHGVFYGGNSIKTLPKRPTSKYLEKRVLPMIENHLIQTIGVTSFDNLEPLYDFERCETQMRGIELLTKSDCFAIVDQPRPLYERPKKETNRVSLKHRGEATVDELKSISKESKTKTFLCYSGMLFSKHRKDAEKVSKLTDLKLFGGSDTILRVGSLFSTYNNANTEDIRDILHNPGLIGRINKGCSPWYNLERVQRVGSAIKEEILGIEKRESVHKQMVKEYLKNQESYNTNF